MNGSLRRKPVSRDVEVLRSARFMRKDDAPSRRLDSSATATGWGTCSDAA
jgi:hypothetical protein